MKRPDTVRSYTNATNPQGDACLHIMLRSQEREAEGKVPSWWDSVTEFYACFDWIEYVPSTLKGEPT